MRNEAKTNRNRPRQLDMPFLSSPTKTIHSHGTGSGKEPVITSATELGRAQFVLRIDTCGFTYGSTITCESGYECTNIGTNRGCCVPGASDCTSTIYTSCIDYGQVPNSAQCGPHTLCCPSTAGSCFSYAFLTDDAPGATFTHVQCHESGGFGEMYPYPPELSTTTDASTTSELNSSNTLVVEPSDNDGHTSSSAPAGAIAGAVCGSIVFLCLLIAAIYLFMRRRRQQQQRRQIAAAMMSTEHTNLKKDEPSEPTAAEAPVLGASSLRPLSTIHEQRSPAISPSRKKRKSASGARQSLNPDWPLGSNGNPLASHPVDLEKRLSLNTRGGDQPAALVPPSQQGELQEPRVPILKIPPPPPPPGTRFSPPPPPPPISPRHSSSGNNPRTPTSAGAMLQSPRLSYVPVPPIEAAFSDEMDRRKTWFEDNSESSVADTVATTTGNARNSHNSGTVAATPPVLSLQGLNNISSTDFARDNMTGQDPDPVRPVSPLDDDDDDGDGGGGSGDTKHLSFVSVPSASGDGDRGADDLVSPISPNDPLNLDGRVSPATVSPLESRQGSIVGRQL